MQETDIVADVKQIRISASWARSPEPETYALMMAGLAAIGFISSPSQDEEIAPTSSRFSTLRPLGAAFCFRHARPRSVELSFRP